MTSQIPNQTNALIIEGKGQAAVKQVKTPVPSDTQILVQVHNVGLNPTDWKHLDFFPQVGTTVGSDYAGTVVQKGAKAGTDITVGDRVAGSVHGSWEVGVGAFANYLTTSPESVTRSPSNVSDEEAAGIGIGGYTAYFGLFQDKHLGLAAPGVSSTTLPPVDQTKKLLVWSGSTSVGQFVIQFARAAGLYVIATASPKNHAFLRVLGAAETFDYSDATTPDKIAEAHPDLVYAYDTFSERGSQEASARALSKMQPSKLVVILPLSNEISKVNDKVKATFFLFYSMIGKEIDIYNTHISQKEADEDAAYLREFTNSGTFSNMLAHGLVKPNRTSPQSGGLQAIPEGLDRLRQNKVTGEKLTYALA